MRRASLVWLALSLLGAGCVRDAAQPAAPPPEGQSTAPEGETGEVAPTRRLYAKDVTGQPAPKLEVATWVTPQPSTDGKMVLLDFWATWCGPCIRLIPELNHFHQKFGDRLAVIGLTDETPEQVAEFKDAKMEYAVAIDPDYKIFNALEMEGRPYVLVIDPSGVIRWQGIGSELTEAELVALLDQYVPTPPADKAAPAETPAQSLPAEEEPAEPGDK